MKIIPTIKLYEQFGSLYTTAARILAITPHGQETALVTDKTVMYPDGHSQPHDSGHIHNKNGSFNVRTVEEKDGIIYHIGHFTHGSFAIGDTVDITVDQAQRIRNSKIHTAGHIIDIILDEQSIPVIPIAHRTEPGVTYRAYKGEINPETFPALQKKLTTRAQEIIDEHAPIAIIFAEPREMNALSTDIPENLNDQAHIRAILIDGYQAIPCQGIPIENTQQIGAIIMSGIEKKNDHIRIIYDIV